MKSNNNNSNQLSKTKNKQTILFVNYDREAHKIINLMLYGNHEYFVISAFDAEEAIQIAQEYIGHIDLLLLDLVPTYMPQEFCGYTIYRELQENNLFKNVPVIFQSGLLRTPEEIKELVRAGKAEVILKPYSREELFAVIAKLLLKFGI